MFLLLRAWVEKTVQGVETRSFSGKEKVPDTELSKGGHADNFLRREKNNQYWFSW